MVLHADDLCAQEKAVLIAICNHTDPTGKTFAGEQRLMREAGMPRTTFQRWRSKLVERGLLISRDRRSAKQRLTSDTWVNLTTLRAMRDPWFDQKGRPADEEDENPFGVSAGQAQAPSVEPRVSDLTSTQAPSVGNLGPVSGAYLGPVSGAVNPQITLPSSIARAGEVAIDSVAGDDTATDDDGSGDRKITAEQAHSILCAVISIRPEWGARGIEKQLEQVEHLPYETILAGFREGAADRQARSPMFLADAARALATKETHRRGEAERKERQAEEWRRQVHDDAENRSKPETRAQMIQRLKDEKAHALAAKRQATQGKPAGASRRAGAGGSV